MCPQLVLYNTSEGSRISLQIGQFTIILNNFLFLILGLLFAMALFIGEEKETYLETATNAPNGMYIYAKKKKTVFKSNQNNAAKYYKFHYDE